MVMISLSSPTLLLCIVIIALNIPLFLHIPSLINYLFIYLSYDGFYSQKILGARRSLAHYL